MADTDGRPVEVHITTVSSTDRDAMPLITSMAYGERYAASSLNMAYKGIVKPGIFSGFIPTAPGGLEVTLTVDPETGFGLAAIDVDNMQLRVFQQHDINLTLTTGVKSHIVLEAFFEEGVSTTQVDSSSTQESAWVKVYADGSEPANAIILCTVDLTGGESEIGTSMLDTSTRSASGLDWQVHESADNPHSQYVLTTALSSLIQSALSDSSNTTLTTAIEGVMQEYIENSGNITLTRKALKTFINRLTDDDATVLIDPTMYKAGDIVAINNASVTAGVVTINSINGTIIDYEAVASDSHTMTGRGLVQLIKLSTTDQMRVM